MTTQRPEVVAVDDDEIPAATAATPDLICWIWAAFPPYRGRINKSRVAEALGVSRRTLGRWIDDADGRTFDKLTQAYLSRRAILRGRGTYLWPDLDQATRFRTRSEASNAYTAYRAIEEGVIPPAWQRNTTLLDHDVIQLYYKRAHVYGIAVVSNDRAYAKIVNAGEVLAVRHAPNKYAGLLLKHALLTS
ncbi:MAG: hypothetical protein L0H26_10330, partial [Microlunatus sp.]|nr:hypothetical protein [Microlunatus sp.]